VTFIQTRESTSGH